jgi:hypothetical protein
VRGLRANASTKSHAELDAATELDAGNPKELGQQYRAISEAAAPAVRCSVDAADRSPAHRRDL